MLFLKRIRFIVFGLLTWMVMAVLSAVRGL